MTKNKVSGYSQKNQWLETTREYHSLRKNPQFKKWVRRQFLKQGGLCWYCGDWLQMTRQNIDHKTARWLGGKNNKNNLVISCSTCNKDKGAKPLSTKDRARLNKINKARKGTYLKNKNFYDALYEPYTDSGFYEMIKDF
jgi:5-methylcytosine-specific restriction endonuclease McrA